MEEEIRKLNKVLQALALFTLENFDGSHLESMVANRTYGESDYDNLTELDNAKGVLEQFTIDQLKPGPFYRDYRE